MPISQLQKVEPKQTIEPNSPPVIEEYIEERDPKTGQVTKRQKTLTAKKATEEISEVANSSSKEVVHVSRVTRPSEANAEEYRQKKTIFHADRAVRFALVFIEIVLAFRFVLKLFGADPQVQFAKIVYNVSFVFVGIFNNLFGRPQAATEHASLFEWSTIVAAIFYAVAAWGLSKVFRAKKPVQPVDVERAVGDLEQEPRSKK